MEGMRHEDTNSSLNNYMLVRHKFNVITRILHGGRVARG